MMKKFYSLTKTLLAAVLLCVGQNAWGDKEYTQVWSNDFEDAETYTSGISLTKSRSGATYTVAQYTRTDITSKAYSLYASAYNTVVTYNFTDDNFEADDYQFCMDFALQVPFSANSASCNVNFQIFDSNSNEIFKVYLASVADPGKNATTLYDAGVYINGSSDAEEEVVKVNTFRGGTVSFYKVEITSNAADGTSLTLSKYDTSTGILSKLNTYNISASYIQLGKVVADPTGYNQTGYGKIWLDNFTLGVYSDEEIVTVPTIGDPVYAGANRTITITAGTSSKGNSVTTYYTTDGTAPSASNYAGSFTTSTKDVTITSNCTVKAITISSTSEQSSIVDKAVTVGKLTLNAPTFTKTAYSAGNYTVTIANDQSSLEYVPASTTIKYRVGTTGEYSTYSTGVSVPEGSTLYAYVEATNYTNSSTAECATTARTGMYQVWTQDYTQVSKAAGDGIQQINLNSSVDFTVGTRKFYNIVSYGTTPTAVEVTTNVGLNTSSYFYFRCNGSSSGILKNSDSNGSTGYLGIRNLIPGQIIKISVNDTKLSAEAGAVLIEGLSTSKDYFFKASSTVASIYFPKGTYNYVYDVTVYNTKDVYNTLKTYATALAAVDNDNSSANSTLTSVITAQNSAVESATTGAEISTALTTLRSAMDTYASVANPTIGNKFDLSYMLLNPNLENVKDWEAAEVYGWNTDYSDNNFAVRTNLNSGKDGVERWRASAYTTPNTFAIYQEVTLPEGNYSFEAEALANQTSTMVMAAGDTEGDAITSSDFAAYSVAFTQASESEVKVGIKISSEGTNTCNWTGITSPKLYKEPASSVSVTVTAAGWATLYSPYALDFSGTGLTAYTASLSESTVTLTPVNNVPANTGVVLKGDADDYNIPVIASSSTAKGDLTGSTTATAYSNTYDYYYLALNGSSKAQFTKLNEGGSIAAGKAYLQVAKGALSARSMEVVFADDILTGISEAKSEIEFAKEGKFVVDGKLLIFKKGMKFNANGQVVK